MTRLRQQLLDLPLLLRVGSKLQRGKDRRRGGESLQYQVCWHIEQFLPVPDEQSDGEEQGQQIVAGKEVVPHHHRCVHRKRVCKPREEPGDGVLVRSHVQAFEVHAQRGIEEGQHSLQRS